MPFMPLDRPVDRTALQLVVTVGPASLPHVGAMAGAGATAFRLNASHLDAAALADALQVIADACPDAQVVVDLQGAKMRLGALVVTEVGEGQVVRFGAEGQADLGVAHPELFRQARRGDTLSVDDGRVRFVVERVGEGWLEARAIGAGRMVPRKGINVEQHPVSLEGLTPRDREACELAAARGVRTFAYSFMTDGHEAAWVRDAVRGACVVGKVEREESAARLGELSQRVDAAWICRGDLGAQLGPAALARFVGRVDPRRCPVPLLMAGQVLEHLTDHREPTRSEVCHLFDLLDRGFAGIVLSDETAIGRDPVHATGVAASLLASLRS
jgi:pyruvate kinase